MPNAHEVFVALVRRTSTLPATAFERAVYDPPVANPDVADAEGDDETWGHFLYRVVEAVTGGPSGPEVEVDGEPLRLFVLEDLRGVVEADHRSRVETLVETNQYYYEISQGPVQADWDGRAPAPVRTVYGAALQTIGSNTYD